MEPGEYLIRVTASDEINLPSFPQYVEVKLRDPVTGTTFADDLALVIADASSVTMMDVTLHKNRSGQKRMKYHILSIVTAASLVLAATTHASFVVDSFTEGDFALSLDGFSSITSAISSPLGTLRYASITTRLVVPGSVVTGSSSSGSVSFFVDGRIEDDRRPMNLALSYLQGGPFNLEGYDAFEFDFAELEGSGFLIVELGSQSIYGPETLRVPMDAAGTMQVPLAMINFGAGASMGSFTSSHFTFEADTERFGFVLDEIRVIPEPATGLCLLLGGALLLLCRRRTGSA